MSKYFELTSETKINFAGARLFRIRATMDFKHALKGATGGWVEKESNVSGNAWVSNDAEVFGNAMVSGNARVSGDAEVSPINIIGAMYTSPSQTSTLK